LKKAPPPTSPPVGERGVIVANGGVALFHLSLWMFQFPALGFAGSA
jgi:hypothetical protein